MHRLVQRSALSTLSDADVIEQFQIAMRILYNVYPRQSPLGEPIPDWPSCAKYTSHVLAMHKEFKSRADLLTTVAAKLLTELFCDCGVYLWAQGQYALSESLAETSIHLAKISLTDYDPLRAQPYTLMGCIYIRVENKLGSAVECLEAALKIHLKHRDVTFKDLTLPLKDDIQLANAFSNLGVVKKQAGNYEEAALLHEKCIAIKISVRKQWNRWNKRVCSVPFQRRRYRLRWFHLFRWNRQWNRWNRQWKVQQEEEKQ